MYFSLTNGRPLHDSTIASSSLQLSIKVSHSLLTDLPIIFNWHCVFDLFRLLNIL